MIRLPGFLRKVRQALRIRTATACRDCDYIPKADRAGEVVNHEGNEVQVMHNGLLVSAGGYHKGMMTSIIKDLRGHHEPQEEKVFYEVLKRISPGGTMIELGSFWAYYSMWFQKEVANAKNFMVEPIKEKMEEGMRNFQLNNMEGEFMQGFVGDRYLEETDFRDWDGTVYHLPQISLDWLLEDKGIGEVDILHSDIQGAEYAMLKGAEKSIKANKIKYIFVSTHGNSHKLCQEFLAARGFHTIAEHTIKESYSADGLIVAAAPFLKDKFEVKISKRKNYGII